MMNINLVKFLVCPHFATNIFFLFVNEPGMGKVIGGHGMALNVHLHLVLDDTRFEPTTTFQS